PSLAHELNKIKLPYSVNIFTLLGAEVLIRRWDTIKSWIDAILRERERVFAELSHMRGITVYPSSANFLLVEVSGRSPREIFLALAERGILIRDVSAYPMLQKALRISIGTPEENTALLTALQEIL
ncbi:MAG: histidinol-phosphate aminotransferase, partial [Bacteroidetes bacterium]|nr:histidinol-phosphate aminotransferase [Bacteroidota bacterium]